MVNHSSRLVAGEFLVASFVNALFRIERQYGVYSSPSFTMAILSLVVYEGVIRHRCVELDFQREAVPILLSLFNEQTKAVVR